MSLTLDHFFLFRFVFVFDVLHSSIWVVHSCAHLSLSSFSSLWAFIITKSEWKALSEPLSRNLHNHCSLVCNIEIEICKQWNNIKINTFSSIQITFSFAIAFNQFVTKLNSSNWYWRWSTNTKSNLLMRLTEGKTMNKNKGIWYMHKYQLSAKYTVLIKINWQRKILYLYTHK